MSEGRTQNQEQMERLLKLQTKLRELTEAKKANWRRQGFLPQQAAPLPPRPRDAASASSDPPQAASVPASPGTPAASSARAGSTAPGTDEPPPAALAPASHAELELATDAELTVATNAELTVATEALRMGAAVVLSAAATKVRQMAGQAWADARGALGRSRRPKRKPRPGDPITAEDLIDDRGVGARLLGAAVFLVGLAVIGVVILFQTGKVDLPQLDSGDLPAATSGRVAPSGGVTPSEGTETRLEGDEGPSGSAEDGSELPDEAAPDTGAPDGPTGAPERPTGAPVEAANGLVVGPGLEGLTDVEEAFSPQVREFARLQGDLAFRIGEYEITRSEFGRGGADCKALSAGFERVDRAHLVISRVVARWRERPERQNQAYSELSTLLDDVRRHYEASGCAPFDRPFP